MGRNGLHYFLHFYLSEDMHRLFLETIEQDESAMLCWLRLVLERSLIGCFHSFIAFLVQMSREIYVSCVIA